MAGPGRLAGHRSQPLVRVGLVERLAGQASGDKATEVRALPDVIVGTVQGVVDGLAGGSRFGDVLVEFGQLTPSKSPPLVRRTRLCGEEGLLLGEREPGVAQEQDDPDEPNGRCGVAALPGDPLGRRQQAEFLVVAQGRAGNPGAAGQFTNGQQSIAHLDFKGT
jgi:hypothetical protein